MIRWKHPSGLRNSLRKEVAVEEVGCLSVGTEMKAVSIKGTRALKRFETERHLVRDLRSCNLLKMRRRRASGRQSK
ncbi:hypothetical protein V6N13_000629 [Hibiscus sabdariffa]